MAKFCGKCGTNLDADFGLCPNCDKEALEKTEKQKNIPNFCTICGTVMDKETGTCPNCTKEDVVEERIQIVIQEENRTSAKKERKPIITFITVLMCICLFITSILSITVFSIRQSTTQKGVEEILSNVRFSDLVNIAYEGDGVFDSFKDYIKKKANIEITEEQLNSFIDQSTIKPFLALKLSAYANDLYSGADSFNLTQQEICTLLKDNSEVIYSVFGTNFSDEVLQSIAGWLVDEEEISKLSVSVLKETSPTIFYVLHIGLSYLFLAVLVVLCCLCIFVMVKNDYSQAALGVGITFTIMGAVLGVAALLAAWIPSLWEVICGASSIGFFVGKVLFANVLLFGVIFAIGVLLLIIRKTTLNYLLKRKIQSVTE